MFEMPLVEDLRRGGLRAGYPLRYLIAQPLEADALPAPDSFPE